MEEGRGAVRLAEVLATLSLATNVAMGQPMEQGLRTCLLTERLASGLKLDTDTVHDAYELALLRWVGCTAHAYELSAWFDDEIAAHGRSAAFDFGHPSDVLVDLVHYAGAGQGLLTGPGQLRARWPVDPELCTICSHPIAKWANGWQTSSSWALGCARAWVTSSLGGMAGAGRPQPSRRRSP